MPEFVFPHCRRRASAPSITLSLILPAAATPVPSRACPCPQTILSPISFCSVDPQHFCPLCTSSWPSLPPCHPTPGALPPLICRLLAIAPRFCPDSWMLLTMRRYSLLHLSICVGLHQLLMGAGLHRKLGKDAAKQQAAGVAKGAVQMAHRQLATGCLHRRFWCGACLTPNAFLLLVCAWNKPADFTSRGWAADRPLPAR